MVINKRSIFLFLAIALLSLFLACLSTNYDYDLFARLIVGERFIEQGILPLKDFLSYTPTHPWYDHEFGSGVVFYLFLKYLGAFGLVFLQAALIFLTTFFVIKTQKLQKYTLPTSIIFTTIFMVMFYNLNPSLIRCQMFSFFFFSLFLYILEGTRKNKFKNVIWILPILTIIWNNLHGGVVSGLGLIFMYFVGSIIERKQWKKYLAILCFSSLLLIINPYGIKYLDFLFSATTMQRKYVVEWWSVFTAWHLKTYFVYIIGFVGMLLLTLKSKKIDITKLIVLIVTIYLGFSHIKLLSLSLIAIFALCYNDIALLFIKFKKQIITLEKSLLLAIFIFALTIPMYSPNSARATFSKFPLEEVEFLKMNNIKGNIVTSFGLGSYVSYKLYPNNLIFMDGRYEEVYNNEEFLKLRDYELAEPNWRDIINNYKTEVLMPVKYIAIYPILQKDSAWVQIYEGKICGIFIKKESVKVSYKKPNYGINYYRNTMFEHGDFKS